ncbi:MAG TPA: hypothetical protein VFV52_15175 [Bacilli bacterium]|nr:hypothetical protein [Bacilli bacterium]
MLNWKQKLAGALVAAVAVVGAGTASAAPDATEPMHKGHGVSESVNDPVKKELRQRLGAHKELHEKIRNEFKQLKANRHAVREQIKTLEGKMSKQELKGLLQTELIPLHENRQQVRALRKENRQLLQDMQAAIKAKDDAKFEQLSAQWKTNQEKMLTLLQKANATMEQVNAKLKQQ